MAIIQMQFPLGTSKVHLSDGSLAIPNAAGIASVDSKFETDLLKAGATLVTANTTTAARPTTGLYTGAFCFDTTLGYPIWWNGAHWVNASGTSV